MIRNFRHKGLERFFTAGKTSGIQARHGNRIRIILGRLQAAATPRDMDLPGLFLHTLKGVDEKRWSVRVNANWRITFGFDGKDATNVDYEDYH